MKLQRVLTSPFSNTYGGLSLNKNEDGDYYLQMDDCFGPDYYGPLTQDEVIAYHTLCGVKFADIQVDS